MTFFSLDTSTRIGSMAVWRDGAAVGQVFHDTRSHAERLPLEAVHWLADQALTLQDIDTFVVICGPGSFTGLRVGVAAVQGWAFATGSPVITVPTLDALAASVGTNAGPDDVIVPCVDGLRGEVYYSAWRGGVELVAATVGQTNDVIAALNDVGDAARIVITGDGAVNYSDVWAAAGLQVTAPVMNVAEAAVTMAAGGRFIAGSPHAIRLMYVRRTDAEIMRERGRKP